MSAAAHAKTKLPQPERNEAWMKLCRDPNYRYKANDEQLYFAQDWLGENGKETIEYGPPPENMHRGALAPAWVFQATPLQEANDDLETYMRRLICALTGRFVCISRTDASEQENLRSSGGIPRSLVRYWWRYWDNEHTVYEITWEKWRGSLHNIHPEEATELYGILPGDFAEGKQTWMRMHQCSDMYQSWGPLVTDLSTFWESMFIWKFRGTTGIPMWDQSLDKLADLAGIPPA
jgi:hypothetical protein